MRLDQSDLFSPKVEEYLEERAALRRAMPDIEPQSLIRRIVFSPYFYLSIACAIGAFIAWAIWEPFISESDEERGLLGILLFPTVAGMIGLFLGAAEGIMCRNLPRALISSAVGLGVGFGGALVLAIPVGILYGIMHGFAFSLRSQPDQMPTGMALLVQMMGRGAAWALIATTAGVGQGIAVREQKVVLNGILGGLLGGLVGGLLFDPIYIAFLSEDGEADISRCVGFVIIGLSVGVFVGLVEQWTKTAWLLMRAGPLAGKQFILFKQVTVLGSSPKADVYLFKDDAIEPRHALLHNRGGRFEIEDCGTADGTYVNGIPVKMQILRPGDQIVLGRTVLEFSLKEAK